MLQAEYYVLMREKNNHYPLFSWDQKSGEFGMGKPVEFKDPVKMRLGQPIPPKPEWVDFHKAPDLVVSERIAEVLAPLDIYGIQLVPAEVRNSKDPFSEVKNYYFLHVWNRIHCLDGENSEIRTNRAGNIIYSIDKFVVTLVHQSIKDAIMAINPKGFRFVKATDWYSNIAFD